MSKIQNKIRALRLSHLALSLGWEGAQEYLAKLSPEEKKQYFAPQQKEEED